MMFLTNNPATIISNSESYLVVADVHLGITRELSEKGIRIPSQTKALIEKIKQLKKMTKVKNFIILGDLKHKVPGISWQEQREIPLFLSELTKMFNRIIIIKGNHDGNIEKLVPKIKNKIKIRKSLSIGKYFLTHGHRKIKRSELKNAKTIIIAHNHPHILFKDKFGAKYLEPVWIRGFYDRTKIELIIIPSLNPLSGATIVNEDEMLGPIAKRISNAHVFLLDGTDLGKIEDL